MSRVIDEALVRNSYLEQGRLCQAQRWLAALLQPAAGLATGAGASERLFTANAGLTLNGQALPVNPQGLPLLTFALADLVVDDVTSADTLRLDVRSLRLAETNALHERALITLTFADGDVLLPPIAQVTIETRRSTAEAEALWPTVASDLPPAFPSVDIDALSDAWIPHRLLALKHRWHALGESPIKTAPPYQEIITPAFTMDWGTGSVRGYAELEAWLANSASSMAAARHDIGSFEWLAKSGTQLQAVFEFQWNGISLKGEPMQAQSRHTWQVLDSPGEPFARIEHMQVEFLVPFHVVR